MNIFFFLYKISIMKIIHSDVKIDCSLRIIARSPVPVSLG